jgi:hypothetical protein
MVFVRHKIRRGVVESKKKDEADRYLIVTEPLADLYKDPMDSIRRGQRGDGLQETQLLLNEVLLYRSENDEWYQVEAVEQADFSSEILWRGYPGWMRKEAALEVEKVKKNNMVIKVKAAHVHKEPDRKSKLIMTVSLGTRFHSTGKISGGFSQVSLPQGGNGWVVKRNMRSMTRRAGEEQLRKNIANTAQLLLGEPYLWGGRSVGFASSEFGVRSSEMNANSKLKRPASGYPDSKLAGIVRGLDCSGLTSLVFRANNIDIPRNAHVQWMVTPKITCDALRTGDLFFVSNQGEFYTISHVMIYLGGDEFIEASETAKKVQITSFYDKFGKTLVELSQQDCAIEDRKIYCGKMPISR